MTVERPPPLSALPHQGWGRETRPGAVAEHETPAAQAENALQIEGQMR